MPLESLERHALDALARRREVGLHFLAHVLGIEGDIADTGEPCSMRLRPWAIDETRSPSALAMGTLADLTMGQAVRARIPAGLRLATSSMTLHSSPSAHSGGSGYEATACVSWVDPVRRTATATIRIYADTADLIAVGSGSFSALPAPDGRTLREIDWSRMRKGAMPGLRREELSGEERLILDTVQRAAQRSAGLQDALLDVNWSRGDLAGAEGSMAVGAHLENRAGHLQGGAVHGMIALAALRSVPDDFQVADVRVQFLRPAVGGTIRIRAEVLRRGRSLAFVRAFLEQRDIQIAEGTVTLITG